MIPDSRLWLLRDCFDPGSHRSRNSSSCCPDSRLGKGIGFDRRHDQRARLALCRCLQIKSAWIAGTHCFLVLEHEKKERWVVRAWDQSSCCRRNRCAPEAGKSDARQRQTRIADEQSRKGTAGWTTSGSKHTLTPILRCRSLVQPCSPPALMTMLVSQLKPLLVRRRSPTPPPLRARP